MKTLAWSPDRQSITILAQTRLPAEEVYLQIRTPQEMIDAIQRLEIRGAPAIGVAAAMSIALDAAQHMKLPPAELRAQLHDTMQQLADARPTAVNLRWAVQRMHDYLHALAPETESAVVACKLWGEADGIYAEDVAMCRRIGEHALTLLPRDFTVLTHCNAGALATAGIGTALAPVYLAHEAGRRVKVYADETRPLLQGSRITAWELQRAGVDVTVLADNAAASLLQSERVDAVLVGADRIAANGDVANKIGTYGLAVLARRHGVPLYVLAPASTLDPACASGDDIPIEHRSPDEIRCGFGRLTAPADVPVYAPAFDVTPAELVAAIVTDAGIHHPPYRFAQPARTMGS